MAAEEMGSVRAMPMTTETRIPIQKGWSTVAHLTKSPTALAAVPMAGAHQGGEGYTRENGHQRRHQNVNLGLFADGLAQLCSDDGDEQYGEGPPAPLPPERVVEPSALAA